MYSRFVTMFLKDAGYINFEEPFTRFFAHGLVIKGGAKMSKSRGNVVTPDEYIASYGADALRLYLMFMGPFSEGGDFSDSAMEGMARWLKRVWRLGEKVNKRQATSDKSHEKIRNALQRLVKKVGEDIEKRRYNTAIASMMEFTNLVTDSGNSIGKNDFKTFVLLLAPFAPYMTEELWQILNGNEKKSFTGKLSVHKQKFPTYDLRGIKEEKIVVVVQVNGKVRDTILTSANEAKNQSKIESLARASTNVKRHLEGKKIIKTIFIPGKLINFVV
jgi:leucyl-tRNA synthetase